MVKVYLIFFPNFIIFETRTRLTGILLKKAFQMNPDNFPLPINGDSHEITEDIRHLGVIFNLFFIFFYPKNIFKI